ncbi:uncharacterized protein LOC111910548 [Lactuca sativa]|uniref:uncharacterized protein LOC111910548 n=1 Tax=Lactuca sativa TaxID=4236 RepID=UPI000CC024D3|nr:uncharacterized protein LOC111910548 [Lactuca sativa]
MRSDHLDASLLIQLIKRTKVSNILLEQSSKQEKKNMVSLKPLLILLLTFISLGVSKNTPQQKQQSSTGVIGGGYGVFPVRIGRSVLEGESDDENSSLILAEERTRRKDPTKGLEYYTGGWNISDAHYFYSVSFSAVPVFVIAAIWFVGFGMSLLVICCYYSCFRRIHYSYSRIAYVLSLAFLTLFTIAAIIGCVVLYMGQGKFHKSTSDTLEFVVRESKDTVHKLNNVLDILDTAKGIGVDQVSLPANIKNNIDRVDEMINAAATDLDSETEENEKDIQDVLNSVRLSLIIIAAVMLLVALLGFLFSIFGFQVLVYILVVCGWILVTATFILCGIFFTLHNVMGDTCVAMDEWIQNPTAHTALDEILPCFDNATAQETLFQSKDVTFQLVGMVNMIIVKVANIDPPPFPGFLGYNQSGPLVPILCNPLNDDKTDRKCQAGELDAGDASQVWKDYVCQVSEKDICTNVGRLTPKMYDQMSAAANVISGLSNYGPFLAGLLNCTFVRETFTGIHEDHCPGLTKYSRWVYIGLAMVSAAVMHSLVLWVLYARERRHRKYTKLGVPASTQSSFAK